MAATTRTSSMEIPRSRLESSLMGGEDFVVIAGTSPTVQLSMDDGLDVLGHLSVDFGQQSVESNNLRIDIERLTTENKKLTKTLEETNNVQRQHIEMCTRWREQTARQHEMDVTLIEEARQRTMELEKEKEELKKQVQSSQDEIDKMLTEKFRLEKIEEEYKVATEELKTQLKEVQAEIAETSAATREYSFVEVEEKSHELEQVKQLTEEVERLGIVQQEATETAQKEIKEIRQENENIKLALAEAEEKHKGEMSEKVKECQEKVDTLQALLEQTRVEKEDLTKQMTQDRASWDLDRERRISELMNSTREVKEELVLAKSAERQLFEVKEDRDKISEKFILKQLAYDNLEQRRSDLQLDFDQLKQRFSQAQDALGDLDSLREAVASYELLQKDQLYQIQALRDALRTEQGQKQKFEQEYNSLLDTWQKFEEAQPVVVNSAQVDGAALSIANAERLKLANEIQTLRDNVRELESQNSRLLEQVSRQQPQMTSSAAAAVSQQSSSGSDVGNRRSTAHRVPEMACPLCRTEFTNQQDLIQHAGICENETGSLA